MLFPTGEKVPTKEPWVQHAMQVTGISSTDPLVNLPRHPSQLYEAVGEGILLWLLFWFILKDRKPFQGFLMGAYLIGYGVVRFAVEYLRNPDKGLDFILTFQPGFSTSQLDVPLLNFSMGQILSSAMIVGGAIFLVLVSGYHKKKALASAPTREAAKKKRER
jgi:phosphatidylglycerol:prolipoprotein diacylglycerol transferase